MIFALFLLLELNTIAQEPGVQVFISGEKQERFIYHSSEKALLSERCRGHEPMKCLAYVALIQTKALPPARVRGGGAQPGALNCKLLGGRVELFTSKDRSEVSFCLFNDGSAVDVSSL